MSYCAVSKYVRILKRNGLIVLLFQLVVFLLLVAVAVVMAAPNVGHVRDTSRIGISGNIDDPPGRETYSSSSYSYSQQTDITQEHFSVSS